MVIGSADGNDHRSRQKRVGDALRHDTRNRLLEAAEQEFGAHGYTATTVTRLAAAAGVSVQTLYLAWGASALLRGYLEHALAGGAGSPEEAAERFSGMPSRERLTALADLVAEIAGRAALGWSLYRDRRGGRPGDRGRLERAPAAAPSPLHPHPGRDSPDRAPRGAHPVGRGRHRVDDRQPRELRPPLPPPRVRPRPVPRLDETHAARRAPPRRRGLIASAAGWSPSGARAPGGGIRSRRLRHVDAAPSPAGRCHQQDSGCRAPSRKVSPTGPGCQGARQEGVANRTGVRNGRFRRVERPLAAFGGRDGATFRLGRRARRRR